MKRQITLIALSLAALSACSQDASQNTTLETSLANAEYPLAITQTGKAKLVNGVFEEQAAPNSSTVNKVTLLSEKTAWGDLNQDGETDAAVVLLSDAGGSGTFYYLSAVVNKAEQMLPTSTALLGDRVEVSAVSIDAEGGITVELLTRLESEPMSAAPSVATRVQFALDNNTLSKVSE